MANSRRTSQEFYCGECKGYFIARLNMALNHEVLIQCPNCKHEHRRVVNDGVIYEQGRFATEHKERLLPTMATYHKEPITDRMKKAHNKQSFNERRDGVVLSDDLLMRWHETSQREKTGMMFDD